MKFHKRADLPMPWERIINPDLIKCCNRIPMDRELEIEDRGLVVLQQGSTSNINSCGACK